MNPTSPNHALQRTGSAVTAPAADHRRLSAHRQVPRPLRLSLSLGSFGQTMKTFPIVTLISLTCFLCGCESPLYMASRLPGLSQLNDSLNERAFREWMKSDPAPQVKARVARGNYALLGLALHNQENDWIPGISERERSKHRYDVEWLGMDGSYEQHVPIAERYVAEFNSLMLEARRGVTLDTYGHSSANQYHIPPRA